MGRSPVLSVLNRVIDHATSYSNYGQSVVNVAAKKASGVAALIVGKYSNMRPAQLKVIVQQSADDILKPGADPYSGRGRINALCTV